MREVRVKLLEDFPLDGTNDKEYKKDQEIVVRELNIVSQLYYMHVFEVKRPRGVVETIDWIPKHICEVIADKTEDNCHEK